MKPSWLCKWYWCPSDLLWLVESWTTADPCSSLIMGMWNHIFSLPAILFIMLSDFYRALHGFCALIYMQLWVGLNAASCRRWRNTVCLSPKEHVWKNHACRNDFNNSVMISCEFRPSERRILIISVLSFQPRVFLESSTPGGGGLVIFLSWYPTK